MEYRLVVDSCCERSPELEKGIDFRRVPLTAVIGDEVVVDDETLHPQAFLRRIQGFSGRVTSSCPSPSAYAEAYSTEKPNLVITLSAQLSGSYSAALAGAELSGAEVHVINSRSASAGELLLALRVREIADQAQSMAEAQRKIEETRKRIRTFFVLEDLENLVRNGRISRIAARLSGVMQIKPILGADTEGNIALFAKPRGHRAALLKLCAMAEEYVPTGNTVVVTHCGNEEQAWRVKTLMKERYHFERCVLAETGGISSFYAGEGGIVLAYEAKSEKSGGKETLK